jgi:hypothetical protein
MPLGVRSKKCGATTETMPPMFDRDAMANWYANRHFQTDSGVVEIHYLPKEAPPTEIRFLEVNRLISEMTDLEPIDFGVDIGGANPHTLVVLDVTPAQGEAIRSKKLPLPSGWTLDDSKPLMKDRE